MGGFFVALQLDAGGQRQGHRCSVQGHGIQIGIRDFNGLGGVVGLAILHPGDAGGGGVEEDVVGPEIGHVSCVIHHLGVDVLGGSILRRDGEGFSLRPVGQLVLLQRLFAYEVAHAGNLTEGVISFDGHSHVLVLVDGFGTAFRHVLVIEGDGAGGLGLIHLVVSRRLLGDGTGLCIADIEGQGAFPFLIHSQLVGPFSLRRIGPGEGESILRGDHKAFVQPDVFIGGIGGIVRACCRVVIVDDAELDAHALCG